MKTCPQCRKGKLRAKGDAHWRFVQCTYCGHIPEKK